MDHSKLVSYYAWKAVKKCPSLDVDDVRQELMISMLEAHKQYDPTTDLEFVNFLGHRLSWKVYEIIRNHFRRLKVETLWSYGQGDQTVDASENNYNTLCAKVLAILTDRAKNRSERKQRFEQAIKLFQLLALPETIVYSHDHPKPKSLDITNAAAYLGFGYSSKHRIMNEVQKAVQQVLNG